MKFLDNTQCNKLSESAERQGQGPREKQPY